jgi:hypothetical protein
MPEGQFSLPALFNDLIDSQNPGHLALGKFGVPFREVYLDIARSDDEAPDPRLDAHLAMSLDVLTR